MAEEQPCQCFSDIFFPYPKKATRGEKEQIDEQNKQRNEFYLAVRFLLTTRFGFPDRETEKEKEKDKDKDKKKERIPPPPSTPSALASANGLELSTMALEDRIYFVSILGLLLAEGFSDPLLGRSSDSLRSSDDVSFHSEHGDHVIARGFVEQTVLAVQEFQGKQDTFEAVYDALADEGTTTDSAGKKRSTIVARQLADVSRQLIRQNVDPHGPQLAHIVGDALSAVLGQTLEGRFSATDIDLPDLEQGSQADVIPDNVRALSVVYFSAMLEELKFFAVADKVVEQFMSGMVPISRGTAGDALYDYYKNASDRLTEAERRGLYARAFGVAQGSVDEPLPNREFSDLWIRFLSGVNLINRQSSSERLVVTNEYVFKNARDLAVNISLHGYGAAHFAAVELQQLVKDVKKMLSYADILNAYGVRDYNQLIERVATIYLGGAVNGVRQRTMAQTGAFIIQWVADRARILSSPYDAKKVTFALDGATLDPLEQKLADNVDRWLAVNGTPDSTVDRFAEPVVVSQQPTIPSMFNGTGGSIPDALRDAMGRVGALNPMSPALPQA